MRIATGHKGKLAFDAEFRGTAGHSASAPRHVNALHLAARFVLMLDAEQQRLIRSGAQDDAYDVPSSTIHAGLMSGGIALNIVPDRASVAFEIRHLAEDRPDDLLTPIRNGASAIVAATGRSEAEITLHEVNAYPGLSTDPAAPVVQAVAALLPGTVALTKVAYGTEAGFFDALGIPTVVCGPGSMDQGHQPDEYLDRAQLDQCDAMLGRLVQGQSA